MLMIMSDQSMIMILLTAYNTTCCFFFLIMLITSSTSLDTISVDQTISDIKGDTIVSGNSIFELGFFSPGSSKSRYLGIWFKDTSPQMVAWVANQETPLIDRLGTLKLDTEGSLTLVNGSGKVIWSSSNSSSSAGTSNIVAQLLDTGNLVVKNGSDDTHNNEEIFIIWQSFDYPRNTYISGMKLGKKFVTGRETYLTSWRSADDPSPGEYELKVFAVKGKYTQVYLKRNSTVIETRSGPYTGISYSGPANYITDRDAPADAMVIMNDNEIYIAYISKTNTTTLLLMVNPSGKTEVWQLKSPSPQWILISTSPIDYCDNYDVCRSYGSCNTATSPNCGCLKGFEQTTPYQTSPDNYTSVCRRSTTLDCGPKEGFMKFSSMKLPDTENAIFTKNMSLLDCEAACKKNCSCNAYANPYLAAGASGCLLWFGGLIDVRVYSLNGQDLYVRLAASELLELNSSFHGKKRVVLVVTVSVSVVLILLGLIMALRIRRKWKKISYEGSNNHMESVEVPLFGLSIISKATNDFSIDNKLGEGGFGPVYKGVLEQGQEIAVKRLSKSSRQGVDEFKNEVICIAKLQHRNLVKLLGYCIQGDEKMLIYEHMPNKSLDSFLFDNSRKVLLDWPKRFHIINGIARGLLYLHQDSRLKVVHRDLKAGNILLDHQMFPKISDFGLARMFKEDESEANTKRVVGTLGYISPEYATDGLYSIKSDIFSYGVLVLEVVSGKKNRRFVREDHEDNLLGHAWRLYKQDKSLDLIDECLRASCSVYEVLRSIHIGLLCVQQRAEDRPDTPTMVAMLSGEGSSIPSPNRPAFFVQEGEVNSASTLIVPLVPSVNEVTLSLVDGR